MRLLILMVWTAGLKRYYLEGSIHFISFGCHRRALTRRFAYVSLRQVDFWEPVSHT